MNKKPDPNEPARDEELAEAISRNQNHELIEQEAREQAVYWTTLHQAGVTEEAATEMTLDWVAWYRASNEPDEPPPVADA